jgi:hypothetical protein
MCSIKSVSVLEPMKQGSVPLLRAHWWSTLDGLPIIIVFILRSNYAPTRLPISTGSTRGSHFDKDIQSFARRIENPRRLSSTAQFEQERRQPAEGTGHEQILNREMARLLKKELADVEFWIAQGLDRYGHFFLRCGTAKAPLDFYFRALKVTVTTMSFTFQ